MSYWELTLGPTATIGSSDTDLAGVIISQCLWRQNESPALSNPAVSTLAQFSTAYCHLSVAKGQFHYT